MKNECLADRTTDGHRVQNQHPFWKVILCGIDGSISRDLMNIFDPIAISIRPLDWSFINRLEDIPTAVTIYSDHALLILSDSGQPEKTISILQNIRSKNSNELLRVILLTNNHTVYTSHPAVSSLDIHSIIHLLSADTQTLRISIESAIRSYERMQLLLVNNRMVLGLKDFKTEFLSGLSGELQPILLEVSEMVNKAMRSELTSGTRDTLVRAHNRLLKAQDTFKKVFRFSEIEEKIADLFVDQVNIPVLIQGIISNHSDEIRERGICVQTDFSQIPVYYQANQLLLEIIFDELITNAIYYNKPSGSIAVKGNRDSCYFNVSIEDTGVGIKKDELSNIFCQFYRTSESESLFQCGAGLGLFMARKSARYYGGDVRPESAYGKGSSFIVSFLLHD